jgi:hypothetical protein
MARCSLTRIAGLSQEGEANDGTGLSWTVDGHAVAAAAAGAVYRLRGFVGHEGMLLSQGHYRAVVRGDACGVAHLGSDAWCVCDNERVSLCAWDDARVQAAVTRACLLCYERL